MHARARNKLATSPTKSELEHDIIERIRQMEMSAVARGGAPDPTLGGEARLQPTDADLLVR